MVSSKYTSRIIESFLQRYGYSWHHVQSYEHFIHFLIPDIILEQNPVEVTCDKQNLIQRVYFDNIHFQRPIIRGRHGFVRSLTPEEPSLRKITYGGDVYVDLTHHVLRRETETKYTLLECHVYKNVLYFQVPCMVNSSACTNYSRLSQSIRNRGYFIINGYEKVLIAQEKLKTNYEIVVNSEA